MAVHAQHPSTALLFNRTEKGRSNDAEQQPVFFSNGMSRKRGREASTAIPTPAPSLLQQYHHVAVNAHQVHEQQVPNSTVSTGLRLSSEEQLQSNASNVDLVVELKQQMDEIDRFILTQGQHLRRALAEGRRRQLRLVAATVAQRMEEKEAELELVTRQGAELERRVASLLGESAAWQAKAKAEEAAAMALQAQLRQAAAAAEDPAGSRDEESCCADPRRPAAAPPSCRLCAAAPAAVVVLPCRHLCLCRGCAAAAEACPVCSCVRTAAVEVYLS